MPNKVSIRVAIVSFLLSFTFQFVLSTLFLRITSLADFLLFVFFISIPLFFSCIAFFHYFLVVAQASILGSCFAVGIFLLDLSFLPIIFSSFGRYLCIMALFHFGEYIITGLTSLKTLKADSFLLNHSKAYWLAAVVSWVEFSLEAYFIPDLKNDLVSMLGVLICLVGEILRKGAMLTASSNFTHLISVKKQPDHRLITHGLYSIFRHPGYIGWFWWSIGTQITLCNPICTLLFAYVSWHFFKERIYDEEILLINFFGVDYVQYQQRVPVGLPYIYGYKLDFV